MTFKNTAAALIECHLDDECHRMYPPAIRCAAAHTIAPSLPHAVAIEAQISTFFSYFPHPQTNETKSEAARATTRLIEGFPRSLGLPPIPSYQHASRYPNSVYFVRGSKRGTRYRIFGGHARIAAACTVVPWRCVCVCVYTLVSSRVSHVIYMHIALPLRASKRIAI